LNRELPSPFANDRFFRSFFDMSDMVGSAGFRVDVREDDQCYKLEAELPGVSKDKINVSINDGTLSISADLNEEKKEEKRGDYLYSERRAGHVERCFDLEGINAEGITADYKDGVLMVTLPKLQAQPKSEARRLIIGEGGQPAPSAE
ncbi:MAG: Hsp20/alpha crystallin family protein, partial [Eubacteriales bacterium]|nr:Hsp20/alpha crystallin family protein [Eubacteriales bacterium]